MTRRLRLEREALTELSPDDLLRVAGAAATLPLKACALELTPNLSLQGSCGPSCYGTCYCGTDWC